MIQITVQKNLIGMEDLLLGIGTVDQERGPPGTEVEITKINGALFPYDEDFTMKEKIDDLQGQIDTLPAVVDGDGNLLTGLLNISGTDLPTMTNRLWVKTIDANESQLFFDDVMVLKWDATDGDIITNFDTAYQDADDVVRSEFAAADNVVRGEFDAADDAIYLAFAVEDDLIRDEFAAADDDVRTDFATADTALDNKINHRVSVVQQTAILANTDTTKTVDYTNGSWTKITVSSNFALAFAMPADEVCSMILEIVNGGAYTITWPAAMKFAGGIKPVLTASGTDHVVIYQDGSNVRYASVTAKDVKVAS